MRRGHGKGALAALGVAAALGGCGVGGAATGSSSSSTPSTVGLGAVSTPGGAPGSTSSSASGSGARPLPLRASRGYRSYELCQGHCRGGVPTGLDRPLRLPRLDGGPCPVTVHVTGPVTPSSSTEVGFQTITGSPWLGTEVTWMADSSYTGPVLIRGGELGSGGSGALGFGEGRSPYDALQLLDSGRVSPRVPAGARAWTTYTRIRQAGCYAYQVDGSNFTETIVFRAVG